MNSCTAEADQRKRPLRLFYATAAPADFVRAHRSWESGVPYPDEVSLTFSGQVESFLAAVGGQGLLISGHPDRNHFRNDWIDIRHFPKPAASGWRWHLEELRHGRRLLRLAKQFDADVAVIESGTTHYFAMDMFRRAGIRVIPVLHNAILPLKGASTFQNVLARLARPLLRTTTPICVSAECKRQAGSGVEIRAQFRREYFEKIRPPAFSSPFNVLFVGRADKSKGIFDIVEAARICGRSVTWTICGAGPDLDELRRVSAGLPIDVRGWTGPEEQIELRSHCHAVIVPTRSSFLEGMAMSAVEAILSHRPLITNRAVPALEALRPACVEAEPDDPASYASAVLSLAGDRSRWQSLVDACPSLAEPFYDPQMSLTAALEKILCGDPKRDSDVSR